MPIICTEYSSSYPKSVLFVSLVVISLALLVVELLTFGDASSRDNNLRVFSVFRNWLQMPEGLEHEIVHERKYRERVGPKCSFFTQVAFACTIEKRIFLCFLLICASSAVALQVMQKNYGVLLGKQLLDFFVLCSTDG